MKIKIARRNYSNLLIQRLDDDDEIDDVVAISEAELLKLMQFVKKESGGWPEMIKYLIDRTERDELK